MTLLKAGADPLAMNDFGITAMEAAISAPQFEAFNGMKSWHAERKARLLELDVAGWFNTDEDTE